MKIEYIEEHEDGGATITIDLEFEERFALLEYAIKSIILKAVEEVKDE